jgi:predicted DNA-binding transcriptional regulator YafY
MRRADRLFRLVQQLRGGRLMTARTLAERLEVSERTIYRDVRDLLLSGVPIEGEAGVGYVLRAGFDLPPLMFDRAEIEAVVLGTRMARAWGGARLATAAEEALRKIEAVLPAALRERVDRTHLYVPGSRITACVRADLDRLHAAIDAGQRVAFGYTAEDGARTERTVRPLGLYFWGGVWTLVAWCELRTDFRNFRIDRMEAIETGTAFPRERGRSLADFLATLARDRAPDIVS